MLWHPEATSTMMEVASAFTVRYIVGLFSPHFMKRRFTAFAGAATLALIALLWIQREAPQPPSGGRDERAGVAADRTALPTGENPAPVAAESAASATEVAGEQSTRRAPHFGPLHAFREWERRWLAADAATREAMTAEGVALAKARRPEMQRLIVQQPQLALEIAVRPVVRQDLPAAIVEHLEQPVSRHGDYKAYFGRPQPGAVLPPDAELTLRYFETEAGESWKAHVYGEMQEAVSRSGVALRGVAIGRDLAVAESPVRQLDAGERIPAGTVVEDTCPVSGEVTPVNTETEVVVEPEVPVVELEGRLIRLCNGTHVRVYEEAQRWASGGPGGAGYFKDNYPGTSSEAIGNFRCLYIRVTYPDQMRAPNTEARAYTDMQNVSRFFLENSFGRLTTTSVVTPLVVLPHTRAWYIAKDSEVDGLGLVHSHARAEARRLGYDNSQFNCTIVRVNEGPRLSGISWGGGDSVWVSWDGMDVLNHECGHSLGRNHANFWRTSDGSAIGVGENQEYGNSFDVMGGGGGFGAHYNSHSKRSLGWLSDPYVHRPGTTQSFNGIYRIHAYDQPRLEEGKRYTLRVDKDAQRRFHFEYHPAAGGAWPNQLLMMMSGLGSNAGHLVDTTPGSDGGKGDGGIQMGRTFSDFESDLHITLLSRNGTVPESLDMALMRGPFPGNRPPVVTLAASATQIAVNGSVTFTATASDPDGDALAYHWDFSDGHVAASTPTVTRTFTSTDQQTVCLTVSDMKGGTARAHVFLTIGNPGRVLASGRITIDGRPLPGVRVASDTDKYCFTDSTGDYVIADLQTGSRTLTATLAGYTFTPAFTNPFSATPAGNVPTVTGLNWTAASVPEVTLAATGGAEGGAGGSFVLTRTGDTSAAMTVTVSPAGGSAVKTTDYTLTPDYAASGSMNTFTIPAGQAALTVAVTPVNDTAAEGPETVTLQLAAGAGYQVRTSGVASLTIEDNDTTRPVVSIAATDFQASEGAGDPGAFLVSRTGPVATPLSVTLTYSGTAANGSDHPAIPAVVQIPAGQSSLTVPLPPTDDTAAETPEDVTLTVASNAAYIVSTIASSATVTITDNDLPVLSVAAPDAVLNESGRGTGHVLISRTGSLAAPLKVYYGLGGNALHGTDYVVLSGEVTFPAGAATVPVFLTPYDDEHGEGDETITFTLTVFDNAWTLAPNHSATLTIKDNADPPLITVTANSAGEPSTNGTFTFTALGSVSGSITVNYALSGTATAGADYTAPTGSVTIAGTSTSTNGVSATVSIPVRDDSLAENTETIVLTILPGTGYRVYNDDTAVMRLRDDEAEAIAASAHTATLAEPSSASSFYLSRGGSSGALSIGYTMSGTAVNGTDYQLLSGTAVIPDGATGVDIPVTPIEDTLREGTETVILTLAPGVGYGFEVPQATLLLGDNDLASSLPSMGFASETGSTSEAADPVTGAFRDIAVTLPSAMTGTVTVDYVMRGGSATGDGVDWHFADPAAGNAMIPRGTLTFPPGVTSRTIRVRIVDDGVIEGNETAIIDLVNLAVNGSGVRLSGSRYRHTLTIADNASANPVPRVTFLTGATSRQESDSTDPLLVAALDAPSATPVTVNYTVGGSATPGSDFVLAPATLTFAPGETFRKLPLVLIADGVTELSETIVVSLTSPTGAELGSITQHTVTLVDNNAAAVNVTVGPAAVEEDGGAAGNFTFTRNGGVVSLPLTISWSLSGTADAGTDYPVPSGSLTFAPGQTSASISIAPAADLTAEADETVVVTLTDSPDYDPGAASEATLTILDDDAPPVVTLVSPTTSAVAIPAGTGLIVEAEATRELPSGTVSAPLMWQQVSGPGSATIENPSARRTAIRFPEAGTYALRVSSTHGTTVEANLTVAVTGAAPAQSFAVSRFGNAPATSGFTWNAATGVYNLTTGGTAIDSSGTADQFVFARQQITGDCSITARVVSIGNGGSSTSDNRTGVMIRESLTEGGSRHAFMGITRTPATRFITRAEPGTANIATNGTGAFPCWVRLTRSGNVFTGQTAPDVSGSPGTWTTVGTRTVPMGEAAFFGLAGASGSSSGNTTSAVVVDRVQLATHAVGGNIGPFVDAGPEVSGSGPWLLDATVSDDALPAPSQLATLWQSAGGPSLPVFGAADAIDTGIVFPTAGAYTLRLTATDGQVTTFDDTTATVQIQSPIETWRAAVFGAEASDPSVAGDTADPDRDGFDNLLEYALGSEPKASASVHLPVPEFDGEVIRLTWRQRVSATDVVLALQSSADLSGWLPETGASLRTVSDDGIVRVVEATLPVSGARRYLRLQATRNP